MKALTETLRIWLENSDAVDLAINTEPADPASREELSKQIQSEGLGVWLHDQIHDGKNPIDLYITYMGHINTMPPVVHEDLVDVFWVIFNDVTDN